MKQARVHHWHDDIRHSSLSQAISDEGDDPAVALAGGKSQWTARVAARSRAWPGQPLELAVDTASMHFFDSGSGLAIGHPATAN